MAVPYGNLYKFMAFFGLLIFLTCVLLPYVKIEDNNKEINEVRRNLVVLNHERESLVNDIKIAEGLPGVAYDGVGAGQMTVTKAKVAEIKKGIDLRTEQISLENEILEEQLAKQESIQYFMGYAVIISFLVTIIGFLLWYYKIQRAINRSIRLKLVKEVSESATE